MTDRPGWPNGGDDHVDPDNDTEVLTGEPLDALFQVETSGEVDADLGDGEDPPTGLPGATFAVDQQLGETLPPELREAASPPPAAPSPPPEEVAPPATAPQTFETLDVAPEIDVTDPGFTAEDIAEIDLDPVVPVASPDDTDDSPAADADDAVGDFLPPEDPGSQPDEIDWAKLAGEDYVGSSTSEYEGLAAELQRTRHEAREQMAVSANMPGMESSLVGLEDVTGEAVVAAPEERSGSMTDLGLRIATGVGLMALFLASLAWPPALAMLAVAVFALAASEFYAVLVRTGHHPLSVFGLLGVLGCLVGSWIWGVAAIPVALIATIIAVALFYGMSAPRPETLRDASLTVVGAAWIGGFGAFALPIAASDDYVWLIAAVVLIVVALDVGQYFVGKRFGRRPMSPVISPKKTVEGLMGGAIFALAVAAGLSFFGPFDIKSALVLAIAAIIFGPLGDLAVSSIKRRIGVKDMGIVLPGHGGLLDRIDALLFVIPAAWVVYSATGLIA